MPRVGDDTCKRLQKDPSCIRNICILAHVDHGKTSLSDSLLATNGIISQKLAGKVRYLDSRPDEQLRGITMESSAISLYFRVLHKQENSHEPLIDEHLINLIDSPGHIDFSSEVSAASRLCDGAVVLVDVVEGVCSQTVTVLRQCWIEKLKPILVLNKIDRLIVELQLTPQEAYIHLSKVIEQVNSVIGSFFAGERQLDDQTWKEQLEENNDAEFIEKDDSDLYFDPKENNVIFASAVDGWGFNIGRFAKFYEEKLGAKRENLQKVLWGDFYMDPKSKKIINNKSLSGRSLKPLFVSLILENIWKVYDNVLNEHDSELLAKITSALKIKILPRDLRSKDYKNLLKSIMSQWIPVSTSVLLSVIEKLPSPLESQKMRCEEIVRNSIGNDKMDNQLMDAMINCNANGPVCAYVSKMLSIPKEELPIIGTNSQFSNDLFERSKKARAEALKAAKHAELVESMKSHKIAEEEDMYKRVQETTTTPDVDVLKTAALKSKQDFHMTENQDEIKVVTEAAPEFDLGLDFKYEEEGDEDENGTGIPDFVPSNVDTNDPLAAMFEYEEEDPFLSLEESKSEDGDGEFNNSNEVLIGFARLYSGTLKVGQKISVLGPKYNPANPSEHIEDAIVTELYLFMGKELVPLQECPAGNIVGIGGLAGKLLKNGTLVEPGYQSVNLAGINIHFQPIVRVALEPSNPSQMNRLVHGLKLLNQSDPCVQTYVTENGEHILCTAGELHLERCLKDLRERFAGTEITSSEPVIPYRETFISTAELQLPRDAKLGRGVIESNLGPYKLRIKSIPLPSQISKYLIEREDLLKTFAEVRNYSSDLLGQRQNFINNLRDILKESAEHEDMVETIINWENYFDKISVFGAKFIGPNMLVDSCNQLRKLNGNSGIFEYEYSVINGFQLAVDEGPLAKEQVQGMCVIIEDIHVMNDQELNLIEDINYQRNISNLSGRLITTTRDMIHQSFMDWSPRIMLAMYSCDVQASVDVLGKVYAVVQQRKGRILSEELKEGTPFFQIEARIPVVEAFGFSEDIRKKTSGAAQPQLVFSGFECIDMDPFWVPTTEEELEEMGKTADKENIARKHMNNIRRKKGLFVDEKVIENAEKQRTLKRN